MTQETADTFLICPCTGRNLRYLTEAELIVVNSKINNSELFFYPGVTVEKPLSRALVTEHQTYIYPVQNDILFLKKETAIVTKNRTENYLKRISAEVITNFKSQYKFDQATIIDEEVLSNCVLPISSDVIGTLRQYITKSSDVFLSMASESADNIHNVAFNTESRSYVHADFDLKRLQSIKGDLQKGTICVLCDLTALPFAGGSVDAMVSFDLINEYDKATQKLAATEIKRVVNSKGSSVVLFNDSLPLFAERQLKKDEMVKKAKVLMKPWKKVSSSTIHFHPINIPQKPSKSGTFVGKTSLKRQLF